MPRHMADYVPGTIKDLIAARHLSDLKGLARAARLNYHPVRFAMVSSRNQTLFTFQRFCRALGRTMDEVLPILRQPEDRRREALKNLIYERYDSIQELYRSEGITDTYVEKLYRGEGGSKLLTFYEPMARALGLNMEALAAILPDEPAEGH